MKNRLADKILNPLQKYREGTSGELLEEIHPPSRSFWNQNWFFGMFIVLAVFLAYLPVWHAGFIWDDDILLTENPLIKASDGWWRFWCATKTPDYFPVMSSSLWLEWRLWGMNATGYHVTNVLLHALNAILLWRVLERLLPQYGTAAKLAAVIFALHPVNVASVAWIAERKNTLSFFFFAWTLCCWLKFEDTNRRRWYGLSLLAFVLALLSKTAAAPLPLVLLCIAWGRRGRVGWRDIRRSLAFFGIAGLLAVVTIWFQYHNAIGAEIVRTDSFLSRLAVAGRAVWFYLGKVILPLNLIPVYPRWQTETLDLLSFLPLVLLAAVFLVCWRQRARWGKPLLLGLGYFVVLLLPVLGFLNIGFFRYTLVADHWQYFAIVGPIVLGSIFLDVFFRFFRERRRLGGGVLCVILIAALGVMIWRQSRIYTHSETLWQTTLERNPAGWLAHNNLGVIYLERGQTDKAMGHFQKALAIEPDDADAHNNLGKALLQKGQVDEAIIQFQKTLTIRPGSAEAHYSLGNALLQKGLVDKAILQFQEALVIRPDFLMARNNLGNTLLQKGHVDEAIFQFQKTLATWPDFAEAHYNIGNVLLQKGRLDEAILEFQKTLAIRPDFAVACNNLGIALSQKGQLDEAILQFQKAVVLQPDSAETHNNLGNALLQKRRVDEAIVEFQKTLTLRPGFVSAQNNLTGVAWVLATSPEVSIRNGTKAVELAQQLDQLSSGKNLTVKATLAASYAEAGRFAEAVTAAQRAIELVGGQDNPTATCALQAQLELYQNHIPFRQNIQSP